MRAPSRAAGRRALRTLAPLAVIAALALVFFSPFLLRGRVFLAADAVNGHFPWRALRAGQPTVHNPLITDPLNHNWAGPYNRGLKEGRIDRWQPLILGGLPATEVTGQTGSPGRYSPLKLLLHRLFGTTTAFMLLIAAEILLMGTTMFLYLRRIGAGRRGALFGAAVYMFNGCAMVWLEFESVPGSSALLPAVLLAMEGYRGAAGLRWACGGALLLGLLALMGQIQYLIYTGLLMTVYLAFLLARELRAGAGVRGAARLTACFAVTAAGGALIAAVQLLPVAELMRESQRIERAFGFREYFDTLARMPWRYYVTLLVPDFYGGPHLGVNPIPRLPRQEYMNYNELCLYMGVPALVALLAGLCARPSAFSRFYVGMTALVAAWLAGTWLYYPLFVLVPGMNRMNPSRMTFLFVFVFAAAAGLGFSRLSRLRGGRRRAAVALAAAVFAAALALWLAGDGGTVARLFDRELLEGGARAAPVQEALRRLRGTGSAVMLRPLLVAGASGLLLAGIVFLRGRARAAASLAFTLLAAADLVAFGWRYNTRADPAEVYPETPALNFLLAQPRPFRVVQDTGSGLLVNGLAPYGIEEVGGYSSFYPRRTNLALSAAAAGGPPPPWARFDRWVVFRADAPLFDLMNARYALTAPGAMPLSPGHRLVFRADLDVYERPGALPRAFAVHRCLVAPDPEAAFAYVTSARFAPAREVVLEEGPSPGFAAPVAPPNRPSPVSFERYGADELLIRAEMAAPGWLVLGDTWHPGWRAWIDGREARILRANYNFRALELAAGSHRIRFLFDPPALRWGLVLTCVGAALALGGLVAARPRKPLS